MGKIIALANQKGGVGKTTTTVNLAACLGELKKKVLVVDSDPQGNTTSGLGIDKKSSEHTLYNVILESIPMENTIVKTDFENVSLCPCNMDMLGAEIAISNMDNREFALRNAMINLKRQYDYILIDCPPSLNYITLNALSASDSVLIPIQCEYFALEGVSDLVENLKIIKQTVNPALEIEGILLTMVDTRTNLSIQVCQDVKNCFPDKVYNVAIPRNTRLGEAPSFGMPIIYYDKYCKGAMTYRLLAKEVVKQNESV